MTNIGDTAKGMAISFPFVCSCNRKLFGKIAFCPYCGMPEHVVFSKVANSSPQISAVSKPITKVVGALEEVVAKAHESSAPATEQTKPLEDSPAKSGKGLPLATSDPLDLTDISRVIGGVGEQANEKPPPKPPVPRSQLIWLIVGAVVLASGVWGGGKLISVSSNNKQFEDLKRAATEAQGRGDLRGAEETLARMKLMGIRESETNILATAIESLREASVANVRSGRVRLGLKDLAGARESVSAALAIDLNTSGLSQLRANLEKAEAIRDRALALMRRCIQSKDEACARSHAIRVISLDSSAKPQIELRLLESKSADKTASDVRSVITRNSQSTSANMEKAEISSRSTPSTATEPFRQPESQQNANATIAKNKVNDNVAASAVKPNVNQIVCEKLVGSGKRALSLKSYDQAMANARDALSEFGDCVGAQSLLDEAKKAKDIARQGLNIN